MSNVIPIQTVEPLRPRDYSPAQLALIQRTVAADCNRDEFDLFIEVARRVGLDPFRRQIYAIVYSKGNADKRKMSIITGIDGFRAVSARNRDYRPDDEEPTIVYKDELKDPATNPLGMEKAVVKAYKLAPDGQWHPVVGIAYWDEFAPIAEVWEFDRDEGKRKPTGRFELDRKSNWYRMPRIMLPKCAEAQALRKGWPEDLSGIYAPEEMERSMIDVTPSEAIAAHEQEERLKLIGANRAVPILWRAGEPIDMVPIGKMADRAMEFVAKSEHVAELEWWRTTNTVGLREFWALSKTDALELKRKLEEKLAKLEAPAPTVADGNLA